MKITYLSHMSDNPIILRIDEADSIEAAYEAVLEKFGIEASAYTFAMLDNVMFNHNSDKYSCIVKATLLPTISKDHLKFKFPDGTEAEGYALNGNDRFTKVAVSIHGTKIIVEYATASIERSIKNQTPLRI